MNLLDGDVRVVTAGVQLFADALRAQAVDVTEVDWRPPMPGTEDDLAVVLGDARRAAANAEAVARMLASGAQLIDVVPAGATLGLGPTDFLHAGPPITWARASGPMRGALLGAMLFEGAADTAEIAEVMLAAGTRITLEPCHHHDAVGPMAGVISRSMWLFVLEDPGSGRRTYCSLNEGLGKVLRYGAYSPDVIDRLRWMSRVLGPLLQTAVRAHGPVDIQAILAQMVHMGDEAHNRNRAGTLMLLRELLPQLIDSGRPAAEVADAVRFVAGNDHFFLNLAMPACKLALDAARGIPGSTMVVAMARNGTDFGIQVSGTGEQWFIGPARIPDGLYLGDFGPDDANADIGDSAITETAGLGAFAMAAAPAIVRLVGGTVADALATTRRMYEITLAEHTFYSVPVLEFRGLPCGIDVTAVVRTAILPQINTGMAGRVAGTGQVGAGLVTPPGEVFPAALRGLAKRYVDEYVCTVAGPVLARWSSTWSAESHRRELVRVHVRPAIALTAAGVLTAGAFAAAIPAQAAHAPAETKQATAVGTGGAVASDELNASKAGIAVLRSGGNAIDAAVAVATTLGVTDPFVAGAGGGGYMVIYLAKTHKTVVIDGRETCPQTCNPGYFLDPTTGKPLPFEQARRSGRSVGVPGMPATWAKAIRYYGRKSFSADLQPAIAVAKRGFRITSAFQQNEREALPDLQAFSSSRKLFLTKSGDPLPVGSMLRNPDLARTYANLARYGVKYFYSGALGADIVRAIQHPPVSGASTFAIQPGTMSRRDLANYAALVQRPTLVEYRGLDIYGMPPSSSGGITIGEALNILSRFNLGNEPRAEALFQYLEASRLAFADRNAYIGDRRFVPVPQAGLLDKKYAATRSCLIKSTALTSPAAPGVPYAPYDGCGSTASVATTPHEGPSTNHLTVVDKWGNVVSYTNTIEQVAGSGITVPGRGFLLNNEMTDFDFAPATPTTYDPNLPAPGKRPRSSMSPTIVLKNGKFDFAVGSPGGATIITTVLQTLINHIDFGMSLPQAIAAPRVSQTNSPTSNAEPAFYNSAVAKTLTSVYGEKFTELTGPVLPLDTWIGNATGIQRLSGGRLQAAAEPVRLGGGSALVVNPSK